MSINTTKTLGPYIINNKLEYYLIQDESAKTTILKFRACRTRPITWVSNRCSYELYDGEVVVDSGSFVVFNNSAAGYVSNEITTKAVQHEADGTLKDSLNQLLLLISYPEYNMDGNWHDRITDHIKCEVPPILGLAIPTLDATEYFLGDYAEITITPAKYPTYVEAALLIGNDSIPISNSRMTLEDAAKVITYQLSTSWYYKYFSSNQTRKKITVRVTTYDSYDATKPLGYNDVSAYVKANTAIYFEVVTCRDDAIHDLGVNRLKGRNNFYFKFYAKPETGYTITSAKIQYDSTHYKDVTVGAADDYYHGNISDIHSDYVYFIIRYRKDGETGPSAYNTFTSRYPLSLQEWYMPTAHTEIISPLTADGNITVKVAGSYYNGPLILSNGVDTTTTTISKIEYKVYDYDDNLILSGEDVPTVNETEGTYNLTKTFHNLGYKKQYEIAFYVYDAIDSSIYAFSNVYVLSEPVFDWNAESMSFNVPTYQMENMYFAEVDKGIYTKHNMDIDRDYTTYPAEKQILIPQTNTGDTVLGYGNYEAKQGATQIAGNTVDVLTHGGFTVNGMTVAENKVLWSGESLMGSGETIHLDGTVSNQANGIVLVFSLYRNGHAENVAINSCFKSKKEIELLPGCRHTFLMNIADFSFVGSKYLYIYNNRIVGHEGNESTGTNSGITFKNNNYVLRYVIGV